MNEEHHDLDLSRFSVRTDLALEAHQIAAEKTGVPHIQGVEMGTHEEDGIRITRVQVRNEHGAKAIGKMPGNYLTLEAPGLRRKDTELQNLVATQFAHAFSQFLSDLGISKEAKALVVGLGNWNVTPDALGPIVVENLLVTRHLFELMPEHVEEGYRAVSALSPGVLGITGIETSEIVYGVVERTKPDFVIAVDALASRSIERVNSTIQISDTGINPGSGVGNKRKPLNKETLGIPVVAIGVPTVVDAVSIASDTIDYVLSHMGRQMREAANPTPASRLTPSGFALPGTPKPLDKDEQPSEEGKKVIMGLVGSLPEMEKRELIREVLQPLGHNLIVTPKEVDEFVEDIANIIANGLNAALHDIIDMDNVSAYTH
ncbi:GPR endopeptidase [Ammoniphilus sp. CFH 90114]|uniref:GPR endopeptidase n=1 Tax=Ammoniphilus sp. CFH 90114 TaxID=2493665 RepID=UPI00100EAF9D|nr:GPR endopeptidase [Ammoniphilus sp. CFH 90114]RXT15498.1 GPR endopeptidase [Ammoniphilus sp. CFH 90114]